MNAPTKALSKARKEKETMGKDRYTPSPIDTKGIKLTPELEPLAEEMARNVHEVWAATRMAQGWT